MSTTIREFNPTDRYIYDRKYCTAQKGWAQVDTEQDAYYYGTWANPTHLVVLTYAEGDTTLVMCDSDSEFVAELRKIDKWNQDNGWQPVRIDGLCNKDIIERFQQLGLGDML